MEKMRVKIKFVPCEKMISKEVEARTDRDFIYQAWKEHEAECVLPMNNDSNGETP